MDKNQLLGRFKIGTLKLSNTEIFNASEQQLKTFTAVAESFVRDIRRCGDTTARIRLSETKNLYCFVKNHRVLLFVHDRETNAFIQRLSLLEMNEVLKQRYRIESRLVNADAILLPEDKVRFNDMLESLINTTRGSPIIENDFDKSFE